MPSTLPTRKAAWNQAAKDNGIRPLQPLTDGEMASGSKTEFPHFIRLRILYTQGLEARLLAASNGYPVEGAERVKRLLGNDPDASFLKRFLQSKENINNDWNPANFERSGKYAIPLEHLHLIAKRGPDKMKYDQNPSDDKIVWSPRRTRSSVQLGAPARTRPMELFSPPPSRTSQPFSPRGIEDFDLSLNELDDTFGMSDLSIKPQEEQSSPPDSDMRRARDIFDRSDFSRGDEQTVNAALVDLMMALSFLLGYTGRILHDRKRFVIPKDTQVDLYSASVDGLILNLHDDNINGFMEVKGDLRASNQPVRRQIGAQVAAFIYEQDIKIGKDRASKEVKVASKGQGKPARAKGSKAKGKQAEDPEQKMLRKWMVSLDGYHAYINIAAYDQEYLEFLSGRAPSSPDHAFMDMKEYGPFDLRVWSLPDGDDLETFLQYSGALMLGFDP